MPARPTNRRGAVLHHLPSQGTSDKPSIETSQLQSDLTKHLSTRMFCEVPHGCHLVSDATGRTCWDSAVAPKPQAHHSGQPIAAAHANWNPGSGWCTAATAPNPPKPPVAKVRAQKEAKEASELTGKELRVTTTPLQIFALDNS